ncbi:arylalkylamine N-acetyltransferase-like 2 [Stomoxys calcitrans]|uniref:arylalkylamine N-acetyltransferase-like 2 n=1 Tax=Stomoxys calcitrans TaxID=35570 RepID=UPI0027E29CFA|nr:arylalkylamine N-acetyltransferase-like 2 [Stomoxys calcitrans]
MCSESRTSPCLSPKPKTNDICIRAITREDRHAVLEFLRKHYYGERGYVVRGTTSWWDNRPHEAYILSKMYQGYCLLAVDVGNNAILGVSISAPKGPDEAERLAEYASKAGPTKWGVILKLWERAERQSNVFKRHGVKKVLHMYVLAVDKSTRGENIGARLLSDLILLGKRLNYELLTGDCTSHYSSIMAQHFGECVNVIRFKDFVDDKGQPLFEAVSPNDYCKTYAATLVKSKI